MAKQTLYLYADSSTLAIFKAWAQGISSWFTTCGWTQTADTGQVNWGTLASVPAAGSPVYEIWQPGDALQTGATAYYLKIQYGQFGAGGIVCKLQVSTSTNGAGTLTGIVSAVCDPSNSGLPTQGSSIPYECYFAGDSGSIVITMWRSLEGTNSFPMVFGIQRVLGPNGQPIPDGVCLCGANNSASAPPSVQTLVFGKGMSNTPANRAAAFLNFNGNANDILNSSIPVTPLFPDYGKFGNPLTIFCAIPSGNISHGILFKSKLFGVLTTFIVISALNLTSPSGAATTWAMRYQ